MKFINKKDSPEEFEKWKPRKHFTKPKLEAMQSEGRLERKKRTIWKSFTKKTDVRNIVKTSLAEEQGRICYYCLERIGADEKTTIEHIKSRSNHPSEMFDYDTNMLACCDGGEGERRLENAVPKYCGASKRDYDIPINPLMAECETFFRYEIGTGQILSQNDFHGELQSMIDNTLNLNNSVLLNRRKAEIDGFVYQNGVGEPFISKQDAEQLLIALKSDNDAFRNGNKIFDPYCAWIVNALEQVCVLNSV